MFEPATRRRCSILIALGLILISSPSMAEEPAVVDLPAVVVTGDHDRPGPGLPALIPVESSTGTKVDTPVEEIPQGISVVTAAEFSERGAQKIDEALRYTPGVSAQPFGQDTDTDWVYLRGFDATQNGLFLDGLQLFSYAFGGISVDPFLVEKVEVLHGPSSALYGGSSAGGVVNSTTKRANGESFGLVEATVSADLNASMAFDWGGVLGQDSPWSGRLVGVLKGGQTQTDIADFGRLLLAPSVLYRPDSKTEVEVSTTFQIDRQRHGNGFFPYVGTVKEASYGTIPRDLYTNEPELDKFEAQQLSLGLRIKKDLADGLRYQGNSRWFYSEREEYGPYVYDTDTSDSVLSRINFAHDTKAHLVETDQQILAQWTTGPLSHHLLGGLSYQLYRIDQWQASGQAPDLDPLDPDYTNDLPDLYDPYVDEVLTLHKFGTYLQEQMKWGDGWVLTGNGRYDTVAVTREDRTASSNDYTSTDGALSGRLGLSYVSGLGLTPYASASRFFEPQIGTDANGEAVAPQTGEQFEVGVKYIPDFIDAMVTLSGYHLVRRNTLQTKFVDAAWVTDTIGTLESLGVETEVRVQPTAAWALVGGLTYQRLRIVEDVNPDLEGHQPYLLPALTMFLNPSYTTTDGVLRGLGGNIGVRYTGESYADNENTLKVPASTIYDLGVHYKQDQWGLGLTVNNVFDTVYVAGAQGVSTVSYGQARSILLKVTASL